MTKLGVGLMKCPNCDDGIAECDTVDISVGTMERGNFQCEDCGWTKPVEPTGLIEDDDPFGLGL